MLKVGGGKPAEYLCREVRWSTIQVCSEFPVHVSGVLDTTRHGITPTRDYDGALYISILTNS